jgi:hypothetical protein
MISHETSILIAKPVSSALIAAGIDMLYFKNGIRANLIFGAGVGLSVFAADMIAKRSPIHAGHATHVAKSLEARALELGLGSAGALMIDTYLVESFSSSMTFERFASVVVSEVIGEYVSNSFLLMG